jgi:S-adenosylmethionine synthetase
MAFVDKYVKDEIDYFKKKEEIFDEIEQYLDSISDYKLILQLNTADRQGRGIGGIYLTVLGTSADGGDCGQVGRGNRVNGIIPLNRPTCSEAAAGKNPISHVGKIYNLLSYRIANQIYDNVSGIKEVYVWLLSQIGKPINNPEIVSTQLILEPNVKMHDVSDGVNEIIASEFENINEFCLELVKGSIPVC